jgi:hypothetical protein
MSDTINKNEQSSGEFKNPSAEWRGKPFWSWNGELEAKELLRQIHVMKEMGMGGYFMHSRTGLITEYLGKEWFELTNICAEEGEKLGMESWLYDEDRWPSGTAGGIVTENPEYRMKYVYLEMIPVADFVWDQQKAKDGQHLKTWTAEVENEFDTYNVKELKEGEIPLDTATGGKKAMVLCFRIIPMAEGPFYNGNTYVDTLQRAATDEYLKVTHEAYKKHCGHHFGKAIKGIFTDEPHRGPFMSGFSSDGSGDIRPTYLIPWTEALFSKYEGLYHQKIEDLLPELFLRKEGSSVNGVKANYIEVLLQLFLDNFAKPCYDWCEENNLLLTGHVLHENTLSCQVSTNGSVQRYYPHMHIPGVDVLAEATNQYWLVKQIESTARQFGQKKILSELYGCTGWQMNFESHKAVGAWQALFGVNLRCHHLSWYTMEGEAKRDYPASILHQSPWYKEYNTVESWFSRMGYFRAKGTPNCDLLVLNPVESVWGKMYPGAIEMMNAKDSDILELEDKYAKTFHYLAGNQIDFDYGDEDLLHKNGKVEVVEGKAVLSLGEMTYTMLLISGMDTIRKTSVTLLKEFSDKGGNIIFMGDTPKYINNLEDAEDKERLKAISEKSKNIAFDEKELVLSLAGHSALELSILDNKTGEPLKTVFSQLRTDIDNNQYFITLLNMDREKEVKLSISLEEILGQSKKESLSLNKKPLFKGAQIISWNLETGSAELIANSDISDKGQLTLNLETSGAFCLEIRPSKDGVSSTNNKVSLPTTVPFEKKVVFIDDIKSQPGAKVHTLGKIESYELADQNICVLDTPQWSFKGAAFQPAEYVMQIDDQIRNTSKVPTRAGNMVQPWFRGKQEYTDLGQLKLQYQFDIQGDLSTVVKEMNIVLERPENFKIALNGKEINTTGNFDYWVDVAFITIPLSADKFIQGTNTLEVSCEFREDINLEAMYLRGNFALDLKEGEGGNKMTISETNKKIEAMTITSQGLPFYSDSITYNYAIPKELDGKECWVHLPDYQGAYAKISSNGREEMIAWRPNIKKIKLAAELKVEISVTRKNTFGPLHLEQVVTKSVGPGHFKKCERLNVNLMDAGLLADIEIIEVNS